MAHPLDPNDLVALEGGGRPDLIPRKMAYLTSQAVEFKIFKACARSLSRDKVVELSHRSILG